MTRRLKLHKMLCSIFPCPESGSGNRVYYQPPPSLKMSYPAIVYTLSDINPEYANNRIYIHQQKYKVTIIDYDPDSELFNKMLTLPNINYDRTYSRDNLNHFVFEIYV